MNILKLIIGLMIFTLLSNVHAKSDTIKEATESKYKYSFIFLYKTQDQKTILLKNKFDKSISTLGNIQTISMNVNDLSAKPFIEKYKLEHSPMPFVMVLAPNGAVTGGFYSFTEQQLADSMVSVGATNCLKALQENKMVVLCLKNKQTSYAQEVSQTITSFKTDSRFSKATQVVVIDPSDNREFKFLNQLEVNPNITKATTLLITPPATVIGKFQGVITKDQLIASIKKATSGCCGGKCCGGHCNCHKEKVS